MRITDNVPPVLPLGRQHQLLASLGGNAGFKEWFLPTLQRKARDLEQSLTRDLPAEETAKKRAQFALLEELWILVEQQENTLRGLAETAARPAETHPGIG